MSSLGIAGLLAVAGAVGFGLLSLEKIVKISFWSWVLLGLSLGIGAGLRWWADFLNASPDAVFLGISQAGLAEFLLTAQPTIMLVISGLLLWFFLSYGQLTLNRGEDLLQKILWAILAVGSVISMLWLSLFSVWGSLYQWLFQQGDLAEYEVFFPVFVMIMALAVIFFASKVNIKLSFNATVSE